jgi:phage terminase large subunit-like protein
VLWPNGAIAFLYSAEEPERLRGPQHDAAWADASRGKMVRAEPVSALYEQGRVSHVIPDENALAYLEAEMRPATAAGYVGEGSPNCLDALVWALSDLFLADEVAGPAFLELARRERREGESLTTIAVPEAAAGSVERAQLRRDG